MSLIKDKLEAALNQTDPNLYDIVTVLIEEGHNFIEIVKQLDGIVFEHPMLANDLNSEVASLVAAQTLLSHLSSENIISIAEGDENGITDSLEGLVGSTMVTPLITQQITLARARQTSQQV